MKRRDLLKILLPMLLSLGFKPDNKMQDKPQMWMSTADKMWDMGLLPRLVYLNGVEVSGRCRSLYAPIPPNVKAPGWCQMMISNDGVVLPDGSVGLPPTQIKEGVVWWENP